MFTQRLEWSRNMTDPFFSYLDGSNPVGHRFFSILTSHTYLPASTRNGLSLKPETYRRLIHRFCRVLKSENHRTTIVPAYTAGSEYSWISQKVFDHSLNVNRENKSLGTSSPLTYLTCRWACEIFRFMFFAVARRPAQLARSSSGLESNSRVRATLFPRIASIRTPALSADETARLGRSIIIYHDLRTTIITNKT